MGHIDHQKTRAVPFCYTYDLVCNVPTFSNLLGIALAGHVLSGVTWRSGKPYSECRRHACNGPMILEVIV